jgi:DNA-binding CsgD family transcriptional regulator
VIEPLGWGDELRAVLRLDGSIWGYLCVHREAQERPFSARERTRAAALVPSMAAAMRRAAWATMRDGDPLPTGVLLVDASGHVVGATGGAHAWLDELGPRPAGGLPLLLAGLARAVFDTGHPSTSTVTTRTGRLGGVEAALVHGGRDRTVAIVLSAVPTGHKLDRLAAACGLTNREREIVAAALTGLPTRAIADQLGISPHTVQAHLTSVFDKTNVRSRRALISRLST